MARRRRESLSALPDELLEEILLRLPPDEPAWLLRASLVCKSWSHAISSPGFHRRLHELHRAPPLLGFLHHHWRPQYKDTPQFVPTTASAFSLDAPKCRLWRAINCRHGRALFCSDSYDDPELLVWEPITGSEWRVSLKPVISRRAAISGAVFCAADGCDHRDCHGSPFRLVFVFRVNVGPVKFVTFARVYSSETGTWGEPTSVVQCVYPLIFTSYSSVLVGRSLLYFMSDNGFMLEYDLAKHRLTLLDAVEIDPAMRPRRFSLLMGEDGGMRVSQECYPHLKFWTREASHARWVLTRVINLGNLLQIRDVMDAEVHVVGFVEGSNVIFVDTAVGLFTIELMSEHVRKVTGDRGFSNLIPVVGFYTPVPRGELQPLSSHSDETGGEEEKTVDKSFSTRGPLLSKRESLSTLSKVSGTTTISGKGSSPEPITYSESR
jgi:hypothetical protein